MILKTQCLVGDDVRQISKVLGNLSRYRKAGIYFLLLMVLMLAVTGVVKHQAIYDQLYDWKLIPRPERLTELYFTAHRSLPKTYTAQQVQPVSFTVHNLEYRTTNYSYVITQQDEAGTTAKQLAHGSFRIAHDEHKNVTSPIALLDLGKRSRVIVTVTYQGIAFGQDDPTKQTQSIHYWVDKGAAQ